MLKRMLNLSLYPAVVVFMLAGGFTIIFAFSSYNLFQQAMANLHFLQRHGWVAVMDGGLLQLVQILGFGAISLASYFCFKACEVELLMRFRRWHDD
jgi:hypothetical protein